jgi:hypothetical protein
VIAYHQFKQGVQMLPTLTIELLCHEAAGFAADESEHVELGLYGVTDGKAIGTYFEHKFQML